LKAFKLHILINHLERGFVLLTSSCNITGESVISTSEDLKPTAVRIVEKGAGVGADEDISNSRQGSRRAFVVDKNPGTSGNEGGIIGLSIASYLDSFLEDFLSDTLRDGCALHDGGSKNDSTGGITVEDLRSQVDVTGLTIGETSSV